MWFFGFPANGWPDQFEYFNIYAEKIGIILFYLMKSVKKLIMKINSKKYAVDQNFPTKLSNDM